MNDRFLSMLSLCKKAGKLVSGFEAVAHSIKSKNAKLAFAVNDISKKTYNKMSDICGQYSVRLLTLPYVIDDIWQATGKRAAVMSVTDDNFMGRLRDILADKEGGVLLDDKQIPGA